MRLNCKSTGAWIGAVLVMVGCSSTDHTGVGAGGSGTSAGSGASGASSGSGGRPAYVPPTCDQGCQDYFVAYGLENTIWFLWNSTIVGHPSGAQDLMATCPLGGSAHITGTTGVSGNTNTADVVFDLQSCAASENVYELTFTGSVSMQGSFDSVTSGSDFTAITFDSAMLDTSGAIHYYPDDDPAIDDACPVRVAQDGSGDAFRISGKRCGRTFNESSRKSTGMSSGGAGQAGADASGSGGTGVAGDASGAGGAGSCACFCPDDRDCTDKSVPNPCGVDADGIPNPCGCPVGCP